MKPFYTSQEIEKDVTEDYEACRRCLVDLHIFELQAHYPLQDGQLNEKRLLPGEKLLQEKKNEIKQVPN